MKIAIFGRMCSGKSTLCKYIQLYMENKYGVRIQKISFGSKIYDIAYELFGMKEKNRKLLQDIGQKMREIDENVFTEYTMNRYRSENVIIEDCRLLSEFRVLKNEGYILIRIHISDSLQRERLMKCYEDTYEEHLLRLNHRSETEMMELTNDEFHLVLLAEEGNENYKIVENFLDIKWNEEK